MIWSQGLKVSKMLAQAPTHKHIHPNLVLFCKVLALTTRINRFEKSKYYKMIQMDFTSSRERKSKMVKSFFVLEGMLIRIEL